jgi:hypothetical protein
VLLLDEHPMKTKDKEQTASAARFDMLASFPVTEAIIPVP